MGKKIIEAFYILVFKNVIQKGCIILEYFSSTKVNVLHLYGAVNLNKHFPFQAKNLNF